MLSSVAHLVGATLAARDGAIGHVTAAYFDDQEWAIRYLVVEAGSWLAGREVLISPYSVTHYHAADRSLDVSLTRRQVEDSPDIDTHQTVTRQHERDYLDYYAYPRYWEGGALWGMDPFPSLPLVLPTQANMEAQINMRERDILEGDRHLRSSVDVTGYEITATDGSLGHVADFLFEGASWSIRYLVVDTRNWWPGGKKVLIGTRWIERIDWSDRSVHLDLSRARIQSSPEFDQAALVDRDFESRLHRAHGREPYWE